MVSLILQLWSEGVCTVLLVNSKTENADKTEMLPLSFKDGELTGLGDAVEETLVPMPTNGSQMTDVDNSLAEFISSARSGRRDALPDITDLQEPSRGNVVKSSLTVDMTKLSIKPEEDTNTGTEAQAPGQTGNQKTPTQCKDD